MGLHTTSHQPRPPHHPVHLQDKGKGNEEDRKAADTEVWLSRVERFGRLGNTTPFTSKMVRWFQSYPASVTWPMPLPFCLQYNTCCVFLDPGHSLGAVSSVITKTGSREDWGWLTPFSHPAHWGESAICLKLQVPSYDFSLTTFPP